MPHYHGLLGSCFTDEVTPRRQSLFILFFCNAPKCTSGSFPCGLDVTWCFCSYIVTKRAWSHLDDLKYNYSFLWTLESKWNAQMCTRKWTEKRKSPQEVTIIVGIIPWTPANPVMEAQFQQLHACLCVGKNLNAGAGQFARSTKTDSQPIREILQNKTYFSIP